MNVPLGTWCCHSPNSRGRFCDDSESVLPQDGVRHPFVYAKEVVTQ